MLPSVAKDGRNITRVDEAGAQSGRGKKDIQGQRRRKKVEGQGGINASHISQGTDVNRERAERRSRETESKRRRGEKDWGMGAPKKTVRVSRTTFKSREQWLATRMIGKYLREIHIRQETLGGTPRIKRQETAPKSQGMYI